MVVYATLVVLADFCDVFRVLIPGGTLLSCLFLVECGAVRYGVVGYGGGCVPIKVLRTYPYVLFFFVSMDGNRVAWLEASLLSHAHGLIHAPRYKLPICVFANAHPLQILRQMGEFDRASAVGGQALALVQTGPTGPHSAESAVCVASLAGLAAQQGKPTLSEELYRCGESTEFRRTTCFC